MNWNKNTALAAEMEVVLDLAAAVVHNVRGFNEGKVMTCVDCRNTKELLTTKVLKTSKLAGNGGSIISKIIELENKSKI